MHCFRQRDNHRLPAGRCPSGGGIQIDGVASRLECYCNIMYTVPAVVLAAKMYMGFLYILCWQVRAEHIGGQ